MSEPSTSLRRWVDLPSFELYMDQLLLLCQQELTTLAPLNVGGALTSSMVNNYVKAKLVPAPLKKRYTRTQLAALLRLSLLKPILSLQDLATLEQGLSEEFPDAGQLHDHFCQLIENLLNGHSVTTPKSLETSTYSHALQNALLSRLHQQNAIHLLSSKKPSQAD